MAITVFWGQIEIVARPIVLKGFLAHFAERKKSCFGSWTSDFAINRHCQSGCGILRLLPRCMRNLLISFRDSSASVGPSSFFKIHLSHPVSTGKNLASAECRLTGSGGLKNPENEFQAPGCKEKSPLPADKENSKKDFFQEMSRNNV